MLLLVFIPALIALFYMGAWVSHWNEFLTAIPNSPPMVFNSAFCLFFLCLNAFGFKFRAFRHLRQSWIISILLASLTGLQYLWNVQLGLDEMFVTAYLHSFRSHPGRMSPISTVCLTLISIVWAIRVNFQRKDQLIYWASALLCSCLVTMLGFLSLLEYSFAFHTSLSWGAFAKISFASAFCFFVLGIFGIFEVRTKLFTSKRCPRALRAFQIGVFGLMTSLAGWQFANYQASLQINTSLKRELENRYQQFYQAFQYRAEELQRTPIPPTRQEAETRAWQPPFASVEAVARVTDDAHLIWQKNGKANELDLKNWYQETLHHRPSFTFYPSFIYHRQRFMAFLFQDRLWIFSPQLVINFFFPDDQFMYALTLEPELILATNSVGLVSVLKDWSVSLPVRLWDSQMRLEVTPTKSTLDRLQPSTPQHFLWTGFFLTFLMVLTGYYAPIGRRRIKD